MYDYDVIFIGAGHACNHAATALTLAGKKVAMVEQDKVGGTCANYGCDAKIFLDGPFEYNYGLKRYNDLGMKEPPINWNKLMECKREFLQRILPDAEKGLKSLGITFIKGHGCLCDAHTVMVGDNKYSAEYIVIGSGARNAKLNIPGKEHTHGSKDFLDLDEMPNSIVFIGAGIISMEFACMALDLGKKVTVIEFAPRALTAYPKKYVEKIVSYMEKQGAKFIFNQGVASVEKIGNEYLVKTANGTEIKAEYVLDATGRIANVEDMGLEALGIECSRRGIKVDNHLRTSVPNIYVSGDAIDKSIPKLTPTAQFESLYIADQILGKDTEPIKYPAVPNLVFTLPRIAQVGVCVDVAEQEKDKYTVVSGGYGIMFEMSNKRETDAEYTYLFDKEGYMVGASIYSSEAAYLIDFLAIIINQKIRGPELRKMIFAFPNLTWSLFFGLLPIFEQVKK